MKKLHILMISSEFPPKSAGIGNAVYLLSKALIKKGHKVTIATRGSWRNNKKRKVDGIHVHEIPFIAFPPPLHILFHSVFLNMWLKKRKDDFDIVHLHSPLTPVTKQSVPKVVTVHSTWNFEAKSFHGITDWYALAVKLFAKSFVRNERKQFRQSNAIITISKGMKNELVKYYKVSPSHITVVRNTVDRKKFPVSQVNHTNSAMNVLFVGRLVYRKGVIDFVEVAKIVQKTFPDAQFSIIGEGPLEKTLRKQIKESHLENTVHLLGSIPHAKVHEYIHDASVFVIPSLYEGLPLVLLEALSAGKPVIGTKINGIKEIISDGKNGLLVPPSSPRSLATAVKKLLSDKTLRSRLGKNAQMAAKGFSGKDTTNAITQVYKESIRRYASYANH